MTADRPRHRPYFINPEPDVEQLVELDELLRARGFSLSEPAEPAWYLDEIQAAILEHGSGYWLRVRHLVEMFVPQSDRAAAVPRVADRLRRLAPATELLVIDPFLLSDQGDASIEYANELLATLLLVLASARVFRMLTGGRQDPVVRGIVTVGLHRALPDLEILIGSDRAFHDRYWIADNERGMIIGGSFNTIGKRHILIDDLSQGDVTEILRATRNVVWTSIRRPDPPGGC